MDPQQQLQQLEQQLKDAHERAMAGGEDSEQAKVEAQNAADAIRRLAAIETTYSEKDAGSVEPLSRALAGTAGAGVLFGKGLVGDFLDTRNEKQANAISEAVKQATAEPKASVTVEGAPSRKVIGGSGTTNYARVMSPDILPDVVAEKVEDMTKANPKGTAAYQVIEKDQALLNKIKDLGYGDYGLQGKGKGQLMLPPGAQLPSVAAQAAQVAQATPSVPVAEPSFLDKAKIKLMGVANKTVPYLNAYGVGAQGMDAINRAYRGDYPGAVISGIGTVGNYLGTKPGPQMLPGMAVSGLAELANYLMDHPEKRQEILQMLGRIPVSGLANLK